MSHVLSALFFFQTRDDCVEHWYSYKKDEEHIKVGYMHFRRISKNWCRQIALGAREVGGEGGGWAGCYSVIKINNHIGSGLKRN